MLKLEILDQPLIRRENLKLTGFTIEARLDRFRTYKDLWPFRSLVRGIIVGIKLLQQNNPKEQIDLARLITAIESGRVDVTNPELLIKLIKGNTIGLEDPNDWCNKLTEAIQVGYYKSQM